jgi:hypothetical protein
MDPSSGKLFGVIGKVVPSDEKSAFRLAGADADYSRWYTLQWLKSQGFGEELVTEDCSQRDTL